MSLVHIEPQYSSELAALSLLHDEKKDHTLSQLLPYPYLNDKVADGKIIREFSLLLSYAEKAISLFLDGELQEFDALVGENACQIRATMLFFLVRTPQEALRQTLKEVQATIARLKNTPESYGSLPHFLEVHGDIRLSERELFLITSYILTQVRVLLPPDPNRCIVRNEKTDTKKIKTHGDVGSTFAREFVKRVRSIVSELSVRFVQEAANVVDTPDLTHHMISDRFCITYDKFGRLRCLPCFWYTFVLMQLSLFTRIPIAVTVRQIASDEEYATVGQATFFFVPQDGKYRHVPEEAIDKVEPVLHIFAKSCRKRREFPPKPLWKSFMARHDICELILEYAAAHRQYPDESKDAILETVTCPAFHQYKERAIKNGCSLSNPSLFFLVHAYCDKADRIGH